jgi:hypothetical protein
VRELAQALAQIEELAQSPLVWAAVVLLLLSAGLLVRVWWQEGLASRRSKKRLARAIKGEIEGEAFMRTLGYRVVAVQPEYVWDLMVDGKPAKVVLRPDLIVEKDGCRYVADVKTGRYAPDPLSSSTRRQLLEYFLALKVDGVLVVDIESRRIRSLEFPVTVPRGKARAKVAAVDEGADPIWLFVALAAGVGLSALLIRFLR